MKKPLQGALIAAAAAALFVAAPAYAGEEAAKEANVKCMGANECKGHGACSGADNDCTGKNECKGKGFIKTSSEEECEEKGGAVG